jgi:hypothetical protein
VADAEGVAATAGTERDVEEPVGGDGGVAAVGIDDDRVVVAARETPPIETAMSSFQIPPSAWNLTTSRTAK